MQKVIAFKSRALANSLLKEVGCTPNGVVVYAAAPSKPADSNFEETVCRIGEDVNVVTYAEYANGWVVTSHPWCEDDADFWESYLESQIAAGDVQLLDVIPVDWVPKRDVV